MRKQIIGATTLALLIGMTGCKSVSITSAPAGADIRNDGQNLGTTSATVQVLWGWSSKKISVSK